MIQGSHLLHSPDWLSQPSSELASYPRVSVLMEMPAHTSPQLSSTPSPFLPPSSTVEAPSYAEATFACGCRFPRLSVTTEPPDETRPYRFCASCDQFMGFMPDLEDYDRRMSVLRPIYAQNEEDGGIEGPRASSTVREERPTPLKETKIEDEPCSPSTRLSYGGGTASTQFNDFVGRSEIGTQHQRHENGVYRTDTSAPQYGKDMDMMEDSAQGRAQRQGTTALAAMGLYNHDQSTSGPQNSQWLPLQPHTGLRASTTSPSTISPLSRKATFTPPCPPRKRYHPYSPPPELLPLQPPRQRRRLHGQSRPALERTDSMYVNFDQQPRDTSDRFDYTDYDTIRRSRPPPDRFDSMEVNIGGTRRPPSYTNNMPPSADLGLQHMPGPSPAMTWQQEQYSPSAHSPQYHAEQDSLPAHPLRGYQPYRPHNIQQRPSNLDPRLHSHQINPQLQQNHSPSPHPHHDQHDPRFHIPDIRYCPCGVPAKPAIITSGGKWAPNRAIPPVEVVVLTCALGRCGYYLRERVGGI